MIITQGGTKSPSLDQGKVRNLVFNGSAVEPNIQIQ